MPGPPTTPQDVPLDRIVTPEWTIRPAPTDKPDGIAWEQVDDERLDAIPALARLSREE